MTAINTSIIANGLSKVLIGVLNIVVVPLYMRYLGMEAYGLVGFFTTLQTLLVVFDLGLSATLTRSLSQLSLDKTKAQEARNLSRTLELVYWGIAILAGIVIAAMSPVLASHWIHRKPTYRAAGLYQPLDHGDSHRFSVPSRLLHIGLGRVAAPSRAEHHQRDSVERPMPWRADRSSLGPRWIDCLFHLASRS